MSPPLRLNRRALLGGLAAAALCPSLPAGAAGEARDPLANRFGGPFALTTHDGRRVTDADFRGRFMLVYFGYTHCPDVCPTDLASMAQALDRLGPLAERLQPLFVTVDPARDDAARLADFVGSFHPRLIGLRGSEAEVAAAARAYRVHRRKYVPAWGNAADYAVDHGSLTYLMGPDGAFRTLVPHGAPAERMAEILRPYLAADPRLTSARAP